MKVGDLVRDNHDGGYGVITREPYTVRWSRDPITETENCIDILWSGDKKALRCDIGAVDKGWVEVMSESR